MHRNTRGSNTATLPEELAANQQTSAPYQGFAGLLRQLRIKAQLTQEELAEAATLSPRSISDLERGINHTARKETARLLADALRLAEPARQLFIAAARGRVPAADVLVPGSHSSSAAAPHLGMLEPHEITRLISSDAELEQLLDAVRAAAASAGNVVRIYVVGATTAIGPPLPTNAVH